MFCVVSLLIGWGAVLLNRGVKSRNYGRIIGGALMSLLYVIFMGTLIRATYRFVCTEESEVIHFK